MVSDKLQVACTAAGVCALAGQVETGLSAIDQAQAWLERTGMQATQPDVWRSRGVLLLLEASSAERAAAAAEACFQQALGIAREQQARIEVCVVESLPRFDLAPLLG